MFFLFQYCSQVLRSRHWKVKRQNTIYLQTTVDVLRVQYFTMFLLNFTWEAGASTHWKIKNLSTTYWQTFLDGLSAEEVWLFLLCIFVHRYAQTHIDTQRPHHHILIRMTWKIKILNSCVYFYFKFSSQVFASTQWNANNNITTYCQISLDGLNDEQVQIFLNWVAFAGVRRHTLIDRLIHHHTLMDKRPMG